MMDSQLHCLTRLLVSFETEAQVKQMTFGVVLGS